MQEHGICVLNQKGLQFLQENDCQITRNISSTKVLSRPIFLCFKDRNNSKINYVVPLTTIDTEAKRKRIESCMSRKGMEQNYYVIGRVDGKDAAFNISAVFAVSDDMLDIWEGRNKNGQVVIQNKKMVNEVSEKLRKILNYYHADPSKSENNVITLKNQLLKQFATV